MSPRQKIQTVSLGTKAMASYFPRYVGKVRPLAKPTLRRGDEMTASQEGFRSEAGASRISPAHSRSITT